MNSITRYFGGKERVFSFGLGFLGDLFEDSGISVMNYTSKISENPYKNAPLIIYHSLLFNYTRKGERPDFDLYDVSDWLDEKGGVLSDFSKEFFKYLNESISKGVPVDETPNDTKKKVA